MDTSVLYQISYGMYIIGVNDNGRLAGCMVNTVTQVTSANPIIAININKDNYTYTVIEKTKQFSVSILSEDTDPRIIAQFGFHSSRDTDKFKDCRYTMEGDLPLVRENFCGGLLCDVISMIDMETHVVVCARLRDTVSGDYKNPMTYAYYHRVVKGKAPKNAPTYQEEKPAAQAVEKPAANDVRYVCEVCGWIYEGDITKEPDDFVCPVCGAPKSSFKKM